MQYVKKLQLAALFLFVVLAPTLAVFAGPSSPGRDAGAPIDGGISLLVGAGVAYGAKKVRDARKKEKVLQQQDHK